MAERGYSKRKSNKDWAKLYPDLKSRLLSKDREVVAKAMSTARNRLWRKNNPEKPIESKAKYRATDTYRDTRLAYQPKANESTKRFYERQPKGYSAQKTAAYRATKAQATSPFMSLAEKLAIDSMYKGAGALSLPKRKINVDHFVPFQGRFSTKRSSPVSAVGLHNIHNLRWMYEGLNKSKRDLIPKQELLQTKTPTRNIFESIGRTMKHLYPPPVGSRSGAGGGGRWQKNRKTGKYEFIIM